MIAPAAEASLSHYTGSATLTYTINSVVNTTNPGNFSGLQIEGAFEQAGVPDSYAFFTGDGLVSANNPSVGPIAITDSFSHTFTVSGDVNNGSVDASHLGWFGLTFSNSGTDVYDISVTLEYLLTANATGQAANNEITLDYFNSGNTFSGLANAIASSSVFPAASQSGTSGAYLFTLSGNATEALLGDVTISGNLSATAVPVPAAFWLFLSSCLMLFRLESRKTRFQ